MMLDHDEDGLPDLSNKQLLRILMQEIADVRRELKEDIGVLGRGIHSLDQRLSSLTSEVRGFRIVVHQNQTTFIRNHEELEKTVFALQAKVG